jgi:hypothetical protein
MPGTKEPSVGAVGLRLGDVMTPGFAKRSMSSYEPRLWPRLRSSLDGILTVYRFCDNR